MGSPKKIASPYSGLLGIFASFKAFLSLKKSALTGNRRQGTSGRIQLPLPPYSLDLRTSHLDPILIRALMGQGRAFLPARQVR